MKDAIIEVYGLFHSYGDFEAVKGITFNVYRGEIFSFLGPNGAGKSTTINVLTTLLPLQKGRVLVNGYDLRREKRKVRESIGIVFQDEVLDGDLTVWETLEFHGRIYGMPKKERRERIEEMLKLAELEKKVNERVKYLSGGMRRRLEISRGLMTRPDVLFLDEPTLGLDPQTRYRIWEYIRKVNKEGTTIFLTTHYMEEADLLSDRISIIDHGRIIISGTSEELKNSIGSDLIYLETKNSEKGKEVASSFKEVKNVKDSSRGLEISLQADGRRFLPKLIIALEKSGVDIESISLKKPTLDDVFLHYTGRELRDGGPEDRIKAIAMKRRRR
ncbi:MAG: ATP-binding cassette domain-containing protein [Thermoplasmata archaeon]|nr:ATP-binding cassette domain-containing protein [Thermoplasmata archaeon]